MIGVTLGDPAGVGPEIVAKALRKFRREGVILIGNERNFSQELVNLGIGKDILSSCRFVDVGGDEVTPGKIQKNAGEIALKSIRGGPGWP